MTDIGFDAATDLAIFSLVVSGIGFYINYRDYKHRESYTTIDDVLSELASSKYRDARNVLYSAKNRAQTAGLSPSFAESWELVTEFFDYVAVGVKKKLVNKEILMELHADTIIMCWNETKDEIVRRRGAGRPHHYMIYFEWLYKEADKYWKEKYGNNPNDYPMTTPDIP